MKAPIAKTPARLIAREMDGSQVALRGEPIATRVGAGREACGTDTQVDARGWI